MTEKQTVPNAPPDASIIKPAILQHPNCNPPYTDMFWCSLSETMLMAMQAAASRPEGMRFSFAQNTGEFMRRFWLICRLFDHSKNDEVPFCLPNGTIVKLTLREACMRISDEEDTIASEHQIFRDAMIGNYDLLIPASFPKYVRAMVLHGGDAVHGCGYFTTHDRGCKGHEDGPFLVRLAVESELRGDDVYAVFDTNWTRASQP